MYSLALTSSPSPNNSPRRRKIHPEVIGYLLVREEAKVCSLLLLGDWLFCRRW